MRQQRPVKTLSKLTLYYEELEPPKWQRKRGK